MNFEKHFYSAFIVSFFVHLFVLTVLINEPQAEEPKQFKEMKIRLGIKKTDIAAAKDISQNLYFKEQNLPYVPPAGLQTSADIPARKIIESNYDDAQEAAEHLAKVEEAIKQNQSIEHGQFQDIAAEQEQKNVALDAKEKPMIKVMEPVSKKLTVPTIEAISPPQPLARIVVTEGEGEELGNSTDEDAQDLTSYEQMLPLWLDKFREYPSQAKQLGLEGRGDIFIKIDRNGKVLLSKVIKSTGHLVLDQALMRMVAEADPVIPVPPGYYEDKKTFSYKITFEFSGQ